MTITALPKKRFPSRRQLEHPAHHLVHAVEFAGPPLRLATGQIGGEQEVLRRVAVHLQPETGGGHARGEKGLLLHEPLLHQLRREIAPPLPLQRSNRLGNAGAPNLVLRRAPGGIDRRLHLDGLLGGLHEPRGRLALPHLRRLVGEVRIRPLTARQRRLDRGRRCPAARQHPPDVNPTASVVPLQQAALGQQQRGLIELLPRQRPLPVGGLEQNPLSAGVGHPRPRSRSPVSSRTTVRTNGRSTAAACVDGAKGAANRAARRNNRANRIGLMRRAYPGKASRPVCCARGKRWSVGGGSRLRPGESEVAASDTLPGGVRCCATRHAAEGCRRARSRPGRVSGRTR